MKNILITGVSRGIGRALAQKFLDNGDFVIGTSTSGDADLRHENLKVIQMDLSVPKSIENCAREISSFKSIDILINNAAIAIDEEEVSPVMVPEYIRRILEVNVVGTIDFTERVILFINDGGQIINMSSRAGSLGHNGYGFNAPGYRISKAALNMITRILATRLDGKIKVSSVHPGWVRTDMGGEEAEISPQESAQDIFELINSDIETGQFWFKGEKFPW